MSGRSTSGFDSQDQVPRGTDSTYAKLKAEQRKVERLTAELEGHPAKRQTRAPYLKWEGLHVCSSYVIEEWRDQRLIVAKGKPARTIWLNKEPDLFIRFAELAEADEAYLSFASSYGLLRGDWLKRGQAADWPDRSEPLFLVGRFHARFKEALSITQALVKGEQVSDQQRRRLIKWFDSRLRSNIQPAVIDLSGRIALKAQSLAGVLFLQLYRFFVTRTNLRVCQLPGCQVLTTRNKFCSDKHRSRFNAWKDRAKIIEIDGEWRMAAEQPKRGRPAKIAQNPSQKNARTKPGTGNI